MIKRVCDWKIKSKIIAVFGISFMLLTAVGIYTVFASKAVLRLARQAEHIDFLRLTEITLLKDTFSSLMNVCNDVAISGDLWEKNVLNIKREKILQIFADLDNIYRPDKQRFLDFLHLKEESGVFFNSIDRLLESIESFDREEVVKWHSQVNSLWSSLNLELNDFFSQDIDSMADKLARIDQLSRSIRRWYLVLMVMVLIVNITAIIALSSMIMRSLNELIKGTEAVAGGDFKYRIPLVCGDELGQLSLSFNRMNEQLQDITVSRDILSIEVEERIKAEVKAQRQKELVEKVIDSLEYPFYVVNTDYEIVLANKAALKKGVILGRHCYEVTHKSDKPCSGKDPCPLREVLATKKAARMEHIHYDQNGNEMIVDVHGDPIFDAAGNVVQMIEYSIDITERMKAEMAMAEYARELLEINNELDDFTYIVSHDLKEPLRSISAFSRFVMDDCKGQLNQDNVYYLERIVSNTLRMQNLIEDLLAISRIGRQKNPYQEVSAAKIIEEIRLRMEFSLKEKNVQLNVSSVLPNIYCDRVRMTEVFANLVSNAIKFADKSPVKIDIGCEEDGGFYRFSVRDNGPGIEEKYFEKIFRIFQRLEKREDKEGSGAGLTIVKKIVEMHRGRIWVESKVGEGTVFYFTIPKGKETLQPKKKLGEILVEKNLVNEHQIKEALEEQKKNLFGPQ